MKCRIVIRPEPSMTEDACLLTACSEMRWYVCTQVQEGDPVGSVWLKMHVYWVCLLRSEMMCKGVQDCDPVSALYSKMHVFWPRAQKEWDDVCTLKFRIVILPQLSTARCMSSDRLLRRSEMMCVYTSSGLWSWLSSVICTTRCMSSDRLLRRNEMMCVYASSGSWSCLRSVQQGACLLIACSGVRWCVCVNEFRIRILYQLCTTRCMSSDRLLRRSEMMRKRVQDCDPLSPPWLALLICSLFCSGEIRWRAHKCSVTTSHDQETAAAAGQKNIFKMNRNL